MEIVKVPRESDDGLAVSTEEMLASLQPAPMGDATSGIDHFLRHTTPAIHSVFIPLDITIVSCRVYVRSTGRLSLCISMHPLGAYLCSRIYTNPTTGTDGGAGRIDVRGGGRFLISLGTRLQ